MLRYISSSSHINRHDAVTLRFFSISSCSGNKNRKGKKIPASLQQKFRETLNELQKTKKEVFKSQDQNASNEPKSSSSRQKMKLSPPKTKASLTKLSSRASSRTKTSSSSSSSSLSSRHRDNKPIIVARRSQNSGSHPILIPTSHKLSFNTKESPQELFRGTTRVSPDLVDYTPIDIPDQDPVPTLKHKLSRVLFSPGVHYINDPRTGVFNFNPYIHNLLPNNEFDFSKITPYIPSSKDVLLSKLSSHYGAKYYSSTSSMTGLLSQLHFFISNFKPVNLVDFSKHDDKMFAYHSRSAKLPAVVVVKRSQQTDDGKIFSIDSDKSCDREMVLSLLGNSLERLLTLEPEDFEKYRIGSKIQPPKESNSYHYARVDSFLLRSQLDCYDSRLPGTGTFDLKTRAVSAVRFDLVENEKNLTGYQLNKPFGNYESFESELIDLCKSTMLKYSLQARIGNMDGIFLAFHNISKMFGFKYLPLSKIDEIIHSFGLKGFHKELKYQDLQDNPDLINKFENKTLISSEMADREFKLSIKILDHLLKIIEGEISEKDKSFRLIFNTEKLNDYESRLIVIATPIEYAEIEELQDLSSNLKKIINVGKEEDIPKFLANHVKRISSMNMKLFRDAVGYEVFIKHELNGITSKLCHPIINTVKDKWESLIKVHKLPNNEIKEKYQSSLNKKLEMLIENLQDINPSSDTSLSDLVPSSVKSSNNKKKNNDNFDELRAILRLFGDKGKRLHKESEKRPIVWNNE